MRKAKDPDKCSLCHLHFKNDANVHCEKQNCPRPVTVQYTDLSHSDFMAIFGTETLNRGDHPTEPTPLLENTVPTPLAPSE